MKIRRIGKSVLMHSTAAALSLSLFIGAAGAFGSADKNSSLGIVTSAEDAPKSGSGQFKNGGNTYTYEYSTDKHGIETFTLTSVKAGDRTVLIPSKVYVDGRYHTVTALGDSFGQSIKAEKVTMPDTITSIDDYAFLYGKIGTLYVSSSVKTIGSFFCSSEGIEHIEYNGTELEKLGSNAFSGIFTPRYYGLKVNSRGAVLFGDWLIRYIGSASYVQISDLGEGKPIRKLGPSCFDSNSEEINNKRQYVMLDGVEIISRDAFKNNPNIAVFSCNKSSLKDFDPITFEGTKWYDKCISNNLGTIGDNLVYYHTDGNTIDLSGRAFNSIKTVSSKAIRNCTNATKLKLNPSIERFKPNAFDNCSADKIDTVYVGNKKVEFDINDQFLTKAIANSPAVFRNSAYVKKFTNDKIRGIFNHLGIMYYGEHGKGGVSGLSESKKYEIVYKLHEYLVTNYYYGKDYITTGRFNWNAFVDGQSGMVCQEYAELYALLLEYAGVNAEVVSSSNIVKEDGSIFNGNHAWNMVEIGGKWYHIDLTIGVQFLGDPNCNTFAWFMLSDDYVRSDPGIHHMWRLTFNNKSDRFYASENELPKSTSLLGDADGNGIRNADDAKLIQKYLLKDKEAMKKIKLENCDTNFSGTIEMSDVNGAYILAHHRSTDPFKDYGNHTTIRPE